MIGTLADLVTRCVFPGQDQTEQSPQLRLPTHVPLPAPTAEGALPATRSPPQLFPCQEALLALLAEVARRRVHGKEYEHERDHD